MVPVMYTRADMHEAYKEGVEVGLDKEGALSFPDFMLKHYPADVTDIYTVYWGVVNDDTAYYQDIAADDIHDAAKKAFSLLVSKRLEIFEYHVEKKK